VLHAGLPEEAAYLAVGLAMEDASVQDAEKQVLVGGTHVQVAAIEHHVASAAVGMKHSVDAYDVFAEHRPEIAAALVEFQAGLESLAASEDEDFAVEVKLADVHVVAVVEVGLVHVAAHEESLPE
jgi:hypothetical protein